MTMRVNADKAFFTSDTHFFHKAMAQMRGLQGGVDDMNAALISSWNEVVPKDGIVFLLGDFSFSGTTNSISVLGQLNGQIHLIVGNHDTGLSRVVKDMFSSMSDYKEIEVETAPAVRQRIILSHYAHRVWNMHHYGTWHLFGHSHGSLPGIGRSMDVGVDTNNLFPYSFQTIKVLLEDKPIFNADYHRGELAC